MSMAWAAAIPALASLGSSLLQLNENDKARDYNLQEAQKARAYNTWLLSNQTQLKANDARQAGLNPAFMNGSILGTTPSVPSSPTSPNTTIPFDSSAILQGERLDAEIENLRAGTKKTDAEAERQLIENTYLPQMLQSQIDCNFGDVKLKAANANLSKEEARATSQKCINLQKEVERINKQIELDTANIESVKQDVKLKLIDEFWRSAEYKARIDNLVSQTGLNYEQANDLVQTRVARIYNLESAAKSSEASANYTDALHRGVDIQNGRAAIQLEMDEKYKEWDKWIDMSGKVLGSIGDVANVFSKFTTKKVRSESTSTVNSRSESHSTVDSNVNSYSTSNVHTYKEK